MSEIMHFGHSHDAIHLSYMYYDKSEDTFSLLSTTPLTKAVHKLCLGQLCQQEQSKMGYLIFSLG